jgi:hypothetical protein
MTWTLMMRRVLWVSSLLFMAVPTLSCAAGSIQGQVFDAQTGKPISGAVVLGVWTRTAGLPGLTYTETVGVRETETDTEGHFTLERPSSRYDREDGESVTVYRSGYLAWNNRLVFPSSERRSDSRVPGHVFLQSFPQGESHRRHVDFISAATWRRDSQEASPKFWSAVRPEYRLP